MKKIYFSLLVAVLSIFSLGAAAQTTSYGSAGTYTFTVGAGYTSVAIDMGGAQGGNGCNSTSYPGGKGGRVQCTLAVTAGQSLTVVVGGLGGYPTAGSPGNGGQGYTSCGGGGGYSAIQSTSGALTTSNALVVVGGGGGGDCWNGDKGGAGGGLVGGTGLYGGGSGTYNASYCGSGGNTTTSSGGTGATNCGVAGSFATGANSSGCYYGGGGGGGYYGGGGSYQASGAGGSSYTNATYTASVTHTQGYQAGAGYVNITPLPPTITTAPTSLSFGGVAPGATSAPQVFNLVGSSLTGTSVVVTAPSNFLISPDGVTYTSTYTITYSGNSFSTILFAEFLPTAIVSYSGNVTVTGGGISSTLNIPISGSGSNPCSGTPTAGSSTINGTTTASGNGGTNFTLNVPGATVAGGIVYQWQVSTTSSTTGFTNIGGANTASYIYSGLSANSWFQCVVSCGGSSATSTTVSAAFTLPASSCIPTSYYSPCTWYVGTSGNPVTITGAGGTSISDASSCGSGTGGSSYYYNNISQTVTFNPGGTYADILGSGYYYESVQVWIDFNDNGIFETSETVGGYLNNTCCGTTPRVAGTITVPSGATTGAHRMRVMSGYTGGAGSGNPNYPQYPAMNPCPSTAIPVYYADTRDYIAIIAPPVPNLSGTGISVFANVTAGASSVPAAFSSISGINLIPSVGLITVSAPAGFQVSTNGTTWSSSILLPYSGGAISNTNLYVQFNPTTASAYTGNIQLTGGGVSGAVNLAVSGLGAASGCSGTPTASSATITPTTGYSNTTFTLSLASVSGSGGLMYQWQSSPDGLVWTNLAAGIYPSYSFTGISANTQFRCVISCGAGTQVASTPAIATYAAPAMAASSCTPTFSNPSGSCSSYSMFMRITTLTGAVGAISDATACTGTGYENLTSTQTVTLNSGTTYSATLNTGGSYPGSMGAQVWIDFNNNGIFETSESVGGYGLSSTSSTSPVISLVIPSNVSSGVFRMRIVGNYNCCGATTYPGMNPCPTTAITYGDVRDYTAVILGGAGSCSGTTKGGIVSAAPLNSCTAFNANVFNVGESTGAGMVYQWQSSSSPTSGFTNISGATDAAYIPSISSVGTVYFRDSARCVPSASSAVSASQGILLNASPTPITGLISICAGTVTTLSSSPTGGTWSSSNSSSVTVVASTGVITGVATGTANITYTLATGCTAITTVTVNPQPTAISGSSTVCGSLSTTLTAGPGGGSWTSSSSTVAAIGSGTGIVTGGTAGGTAIITYTLPTGCSSTFSITVNPLSAISGTPSMCNGFTTSLSDATAGGVWSSTNTGVATINTTGVVTSVSVGTTTVSYFIAATGCAATQLVAVTNPPSVFNISGGGSYCSGGTGVSIGMAGSNAGMSYTLFYGTTPIATATAAGFAFTFPGLFTGAGTYGVIAANSTPCATTMNGTATVTVNALPTQFAVSASGGGAYCAGGSGVHIFLSSSQIGVNYQLFNGPTPVGSFIPGTSASLDFGVVTATGSYTVVGNNTATSCTNGMANAVSVTINPLPAPFAISPSSGGYCVGGSGVAVTLGSSTVGINYQLLISGVATGSPLSGTGTLLNFGLQSIGGNYTVLATNSITGCANTMTGTSTLTVNALPTTFSVIGGGSICPGSSGASVQLNGSQAGVNYQLFRNSVSLGTSGSMTGTGSLLDYGAQITPGAYTVVATNPATTCTSNMASSANIFINPSPVPFAITESAASYCAGAAGVHIGLSGSVTGTNYTLYIGTTIAGAASGTGAAIDFGLQIAAGTYIANGLITSTGCGGAMSGTQSVAINALPTPYTVTVAGGGSYCAGGAGQIVGLSNSQSGVSYQLFRGGIAAGTAVAGTGSAISFPAQTIAGTYTVVATNTVTLCASNMTGSAAIIINPTPTVFTLTGGGGYCAGGTGLHIGLSGSDIGVNYQLNSGGPVGAPMSGVGAGLDFGIFTAPGAYTVSAINSLTGCTSTMAGSQVITVNPLPALNNITVTGSSSYCAGSTGVVVNLNGSATGNSYQLYNGTLAAGAPVSGTSSAISFGPQTGAGVYTAIATNTVTGCTRTMTGSATVAVLPVPVAYNVTVTGGGAYCAGGTGLHINLSNSTAGVKYQLFNTSGPVAGALLNGNGFPLDFGLQTAAGAYTVVGTDSTSLCTGNMAGSATILVNALPTPYVIGGGGNYCAGGAGQHISLSNSTIGVNYQLMVGTSFAGAPMAGTGVALDFGAQTVAGIYKIVATNATTGCTNTMTGTMAIGITALPTTYPVTGGGNYCPGGAGVNIGLGSSVSGTVYQLYRGAAVVGAPFAGTGAALDFGLNTNSGVYTVVATNLATTCTNSMTGSVTVGLSSLPVVYNVTGTGNYCPGGAGTHVGLSGSATGVTYQLFRGGSIVGSPFTGTGAALDFGLQTAGTYTTVATGITTACTNNMNGSAVVSFSALPVSYTITGGGNYCAGGTGAHVGLSGSAASTWYQLYLGTTLVGSPMAGTGSALDFGLQTGAGIYTVNANSTTTTCSSSMTGSVTIATNALPVAFTVTGGGNYCAGGAGSDIMLNGSATGVSYQLYNGSAMVGGSMAGTGSPLDFGMQSATGSYMVIATDAATLCTSNMTGGAIITVNPLPTAFAVTGGGSYCSGSGGVHVIVAGSNIGTTYQLFRGGVVVSGSMPGTGLSLDFGLQTVAGTYTVAGTNSSTSCTGNMTGSVIVGVNALPTAYTISAAGSSYCAGGTGIDISLSGSDIGTNYQLYNGTTPVGGTMAGTSAALDFGYRTATGTYTVVAINTATSCSGNMSGAASVAISPLPVAYTVTGGGSICSGETGAHIGLSGSNAGVLYQLFKGTSMIGGPIAGSGSALDFGAQAINGSYTVVASVPGSSCTNNMAGSASIIVNTLPLVYTVTGGGNYCASGSGVHVYISGSATGVSYQLYRAGSSVDAPMAGNGLGLDFGLKTVGGSYTVVATKATTGCSSNMSGAATIGINALPLAYSVTGGGNYCPGGTGVHVGLSGSASGVTYQLYNGSTISGAAVSGSGSSIDFGLQTAAGSYVVTASNSTTGCVNNMSGSQVVVINTLPVAYTVIGGGSYCSGTGGIHVGLAGSDAGISYQAYSSFAAVGSPVIGTGGTLDLGAELAAGAYTVIGTNLSTTCSNNMLGSTNVIVNPSVTPAVSINSSGGAVLCSGASNAFTGVTVNGGTAPSYQWTVNGIVVGTSNHYNYIPVNGDVIGVTLTSNAQCATTTVVNATLDAVVNPMIAPSVLVNATPGTEVCNGTTVTYNAAATGGGTAPVYSWIKGGTTVGTSSAFSYIPADGDMVYCVLTSNYHCRTVNSASSNQIHMTVDMPTAPVVTISAQPGTHIAAGQSAVFTAAATNAGTSPSYQWMVNAAPVGSATSPVFVTSNLNDLDVVSCEVTSSGACSGITGSSSVVMHIAGVGVKPVVLTGSDIKLIPNPSNGLFTVKGTLATTNDQDMSLEITDMLGQVIYTAHVIVHNGELNEKVRLTNLANGMYILNLRSDSDSKVFHVVIEQ
jgi:hypothetical protein